MQSTTEKPKFRYDSEPQRLFVLGEVQTSRKWPGCNTATYFPAVPTDEDYANGKPKSYRIVWYADDFQEGFLVEGFQFYGQSIGFDTTPPTERNPVTGRPGLMQTTFSPEFVAANGLPERVDRRVHSPAFTPPSFSEEQRRDQGGHYGDPDALQSHTAPAAPPAGMPAGPHAGAQHVPPAPANFQPAPPAVAQPQPAQEVVSELYQAASNQMTTLLENCALSHSELARLTGCHDSPRAMEIQKLVTTCLIRLSETYKSGLSLEEMITLAACGFMQLHRALDCNMPPTAQDIQKLTVTISIWHGKSQGHVYNDADMRALTAW